ncbi:MAG TPA: Chromate resistance protein ChrB [Candidatus Limnocylindria bacterium]|nr:Chromate resistance protein ChrB [Candidatus Limnocylindria bacterium]
MKAQEWVFLLHRLPREPSAPRLALWRALRRLGALIVSDGLAALPAGPRTIEHMQWLASGLAEHGGSGSVWVARPATRREGETLAAQSRTAVDAEYQALVAEATDATDESDATRRRTIQRLRRQLRGIEGRDFFGATSGARARRAVAALAATDQTVAVR